MKMRERVAVHAWGGRGGGARCCWLMDRGLEGSPPPAEVWTCGPGACVAQRPPQELQAEGDAAPPPNPHPPTPTPIPSEPHLLPEDGVGLIAAHRQGVPLEAEVDRGVVVADVGHVLEGRAEAGGQPERAPGPTPPPGPRPMAGPPAALWLQRAHSTRRGPRTAGPWDPWRPEEPDSFPRGRAQPAHGKPTPGRGPSHWHPCLPPQPLPLRVLRPRPLKRLQLDHPRPWSRPPPSSPQ